MKDYSKKRGIYLWDYYHIIPSIYVFEHILGEPSENDEVLYIVPKSELKNICFGC